MVTTIQKWGNSQGIRLPKHLLQAIKWRENEKISIQTKDGKIIIEQAQTTQRKNIKELFAGFQGTYESPEIDWGKPVGKEIW